MKMLKHILAPLALASIFVVPACEEPEPEDLELIDPDDEDDEDEPDDCDDDDAIVDNDVRKLDPETAPGDRAVEPPTDEPEPPVFRQCVEEPDDDGEDPAGHDDDIR